MKKSKLARLLAKSESNKEFSQKDSFETISLTDKLAQFQFGGNRNGSCSNNGCGSGSTNYTCSNSGCSGTTDMGCSA